MDYSYPPKSTTKSTINGCTKPSDAHNSQSHTKESFDLQFSSTFNSIFQPFFQFRPISSSGRSFRKAITHTGYDGRHMGRWSLTSKLQPLECTVSILDRRGNHGECAINCQFNPVQGNNLQQNEDLWLFVETPCCCRNNWSQGASYIFSQPGSTLSKQLTEGPNTLAKRG